MKREQGRVSSRHEKAIPGVATPADGASAGPGTVSSQHGSYLQMAAEAAACLGFLQLMEKVPGV